MGLAGQAEESLPVLLQNLDNPQAVAGVLTPAEDSPGQACQLIGLEGLPAPDYGLFPIPSYQEGNAYVASMGVESKRGCPHRCSYCLYTALQGNTVRLLSPELVVDELQRLSQDHGVGMMHFTDPVLNQPAKHLRAICRGIIARGLDIGWTGFFREDALCAGDLDLYQRAGLKAIYFSGDGACSQHLELLQKGLSVAQIETASRISATSGIITVYHFLVNLPGESQATVDQTRALVKRIMGWHLQSRNPAAMVFNNLRLYPGAPLTRRIMDSGLMAKDTDLLYPVYFNPPPFDGLRHELSALVSRPEYLGLDGQGEPASCAL